MDNNSDNDKDIMEKQKKPAKYDVRKDVPFFCLIGNTQASLYLMIEPGPHGDEKGTHAHFHTILSCPKIRIVDIPEPDRCQILNRTCPFIAPLGSHKRKPELRKLDYAHTIIQMMAFIEFYGTQLVNVLLATKGLRRAKDNLRLLELTRIMLLSDLIDKQQFQKIGKLRKIRNKLAHRPKEYLRFSETELFQSSMEARELSYLFGKILHEVTNSLK